MVFLNGIVTKIKYLQVHNYMYVCMYKYFVLTTIHTYIVTYNHYNVGNIDKNTSLHLHK